MTDKTELQMVTDKETEENSLITRYKEDEDLRNLEKYKMRNLDDSADMSGVANVTLPLPALVIAKTISKLIGVQRQPQVVADKKVMGDKATTYIEEFIEDSEYETDVLLNKRGEVPAFNFNADISCSRGRIAEQVLTRTEEGVYISDVRPLDTRYFRYAMGANGMLWGAPITWRTKEQILDEYPEAEGRLGSTVRGTSSYKVTDIWTKKRKDKDDKVHEAENIIYIGDAEIRRKKSSEVLGYPIDYPPFNVQVVSTGSVLKGSDSLKHTGESVYETLRHIFPERNFIATTLKTLNYQLFVPPVQFPTEGGLNQTSPEKHPATPGEVTMTEKGAPITPVFTPDIRAYTTLYDETTKEILEMAGYSSMDFGQLSWPLSDRALGRLAQGKLELLAPRLQALSLLLQARFRMIIEQFLAMGKAIKIGELGHRREYSPEKMKGEYTIKFRYFSISKTEMATDASIANAMGNDVSEDYKRREIYKLPDPDGEKSKLYAEQAEQMDPAILLYNQGHSLIDAKRDVEARLVLERLESLIKQRKTQGPEEPQIPERRKRTLVPEEKGRAPVS